MTTEPEIISHETVAADEAATRPATTGAECAALADEANAAPFAAELSEVELLRLEKARLLDENAALKKDRAECIELAEEHATKLRDHEDLKSRAKKAKDEADVLADALSKKVRGEVQTEIDPEDDAEQDMIEFQPGAETPNAASLDAIDVAGLDWSQVERSALSALVSTGKPAKVRPVDILSLSYVLVDVQDRVAVFHQVMDAEQFVNVHKIEGASRPDERGADLERLGKVAGVPVKVGRKVLWLAAAPLLVRIPPDAAISAAPLAGPGSDLVSNRIFAQLEAAPTVEHMTVDALAKILGVEPDVVRNAAKGSDRLVYEKGEDGEERISRA